MRIGLSGSGATIERMVDQAIEAEAEGFNSLWYAGAVGGDPLALLAVIGRATNRVELGTSVVQTYPRHPVQMAQTAAAIGRAVGPGRFTLGVGVSHRPVIEGYGMSYEAPAKHLHEYLSVLSPLLSSGRVRFEGELYRAQSQVQLPDGGVPIVVAALSALSLKSAGTSAAGTITWMANRRAIEEHVAPRLRAAADSAGRPAPRVIVGLPIAVTDDVDAGRQAAAQQFAMYGALPNYQRILRHGGVSSPAEAAIIGSEDAVATELRALMAAGATDFWAAIMPVGDDRRASRERTRSLLRDLLKD